MSPMHLTSFEASASTAHALRAAVTDSIPVWIGPLVISVGSTVIHQRYHQDSFFRPAPLYFATLLLASGSALRSFARARPTRR